MRLGGTANGASAVDACVIRAGCSMRLSTPPRLSASFQIFVRATSRDRLLLARRRGTRPCRRSSASGARRARGPDGRAGPGRGHARRSDGARGRRRSRPRSRSGAPSAPRASSPRAARARQSNGPGTAPSDFCRNASRSEIASSFVATKPPTTSECPPRYFVVECSTTSAPSASGCWRYGRRERVVDDDERADRVRRVGRGADVDEVEQRVRRRLEPDEPRLLVEVLAEAARDLVARRGT